MMIKIVADNKIPYLQGLLEPVAQVVYRPAAQIAPVDLKDAKVLLTRTRTICNNVLLDGSNVEFIGTATIGLDHIDLDYCCQHGISVASAPGCNAPAVAQWVLVSILKWIEIKKVEYPITLGVVGVGHVGKIVVRWARQLGFRVLLYDPPRANEEGEDQFSSLEALQRECDIITFHTPLTCDGEYATWHMCDASFLSGLKKCRLIMNAARGSVCDNQALLQWQGDVAIDCWEDEPNISRPLLEKAFVATPHIAGYSLQGKQRGTAMIVEALNRRYGWGIVPCQADTPPNGINQVTSEQIQASYDPLADTAKLKSSPVTFEQQRNDYHLRQEVK